MERIHDVAVCVRGNVKPGQSRRVSPLRRRQDQTEVRRGVPRVGMQSNLPFRPARFFRPSRQWRFVEQFQRDPLGRKTAQQPCRP